MSLLPIKLPPKVTRKIGKLAFKTAKSKPGIFIIVGMALGGAAIIFTGIDTWKGKDQLDEDRNKIKELKKPQENTDENEVLISEEERKILLSKARKEFAVDIIKVYWKEAALTAGAAFFILRGKKLYKRQIAELATMYGALLESYRRYRQNVVNDLGIEKDQEYMYGLKKVEAVDSETGEVSETYIESPIGNAASRYARWLNEGTYDRMTNTWIWQNTLFDRNKLKMERDIRGIQNNCNDILTRRGYLTLNEVYEMLRLPPSEEGQHVGWVKGGLVDGTPCDDFVDFGVFPDYANGRYQLPINKIWLDMRSNQDAPLLDFNVVCIDSIWNDIYEYNNRSLLSYDKRRRINEGMTSSAESLNRFFINNDIMESEGH